MQMIEDSLSPEQLAKFRAEEKQRGKFVEVEKLEMVLPYGNRHDRRKAEKIAELEKRALEITRP